jgi:AcrR family transcriptional regulator
MGQASSRRRAPRRTQQRSLATRDRLIDASLQVFAANGFEGATTRTIAERAGVALAAIPHHFETKEALWRAAADRIFARLREQFVPRLQGLEGVDARTRMRLLLRDFVRFAARHPELHRFMLQEGTGSSDRLAWLVETHVAPVYRVMSGLIAESQREGLVSAGRAAHLFYAIVGAASMPYAVAPEFELLTGERPDSDRLVEAHVDALAALFLRDAGA